MTRQIRTLLEEVLGEKLANAFQHMVVLENNRLRHEGFMLWLESVDEETEEKRLRPWQTSGGPLQVLALKRELTQREFESMAQSMTSAFRVVVTGPLAVFLSRRAKKA